ncbi:MAG: class I SAM-dependent methyltransferase [Rhodobacteraceae bacterium]|nr:class I SAM-dependent methyltransferase [Paracoccaceae bacterium]
MADLKHAQGQEIPAAVAGLSFAAFGHDDLMNLILQRSEVMWDVPRSGRVIRAWNEGDLAPISAEVARLGSEIARRAATVIHAEYLALAPLLAELQPRRIADIGCGYAMFDLFAAQDLATDLLLIDIEANERRHFGFADAGAAYSSLAVARAFLEQNGVEPGRIETLNPSKRDPLTAAPVDLAVSFLSCGFHYPVASYLDYFARAVAPGGAIILDLRETTAAEQVAALARLGVLSDLPAPPKARRVLVRKGAGA